MFFASKVTSGARTWTGANGNRDQLIEQYDSATYTITGWTYKVAADDSQESYDAVGRLLTIRSRNGGLTTLTYSTAATPIAVAPRAGLLVSVKNPFGRELRLSYDAANRIREVLTPGAVSGLGAGSASSPIRYAYDESTSLASGMTGTGQLTSVTWQDGSVRRYHYEDARYPGALTGITDEAGVRYATYTYDHAGRVNHTEHVGGIDRADFSYADFTSGASSTTNTVTTYSSSGTPIQSIYTFTDIGGARYPSSVSVPCEGCGNTQQSTTYNATGDPTKTIAHDGTVTFYAYDAKGRETERATFSSAYQSATTRPALTAATSVTSNQWHATWNLPTQTAEPGKITAYTYDSKGNLTGQSWTATTDTTGRLKFSAPKTGTTYATGWSYNANSLATTIVERETPAGTTTATETGRWTLAYNALGDVTSIKDVKRNLTATMSSYDAHGRMLAGRTDAGVPINFTYSPRGFVKTKVVNGQTITFVQNAIGLTTEVRMPDNETLTYVYDSTHRLTDIKLNGASITPTMLAKGEYPDTVAKATLEQLKVLARQFGEALIPPAFAQSTPTLPGRFPVPVTPGRPMPGQPEFDPRTDMLMVPMSPMDRAITKVLEKFAELCECKPEGGYDRPTFTMKTFAHLRGNGHLAERFSTKSYFASTEKIGQAFVDEVMTKQIKSAVEGKRMIVWADMGRIVGHERFAGGFVPTRRVKMIYELEECGFPNPRSRNEVVTLYPGS